MLDLSRTVIVRAPKPHPREAKAVAVLVEAVRDRTGIALPQEEAVPPGSRPAVVVGTEASLGETLAPWREALDALPRPGREGYRLLTPPGGRPVVLVAGADSRGTLYGVGGLLRRLVLADRSIVLDADLRLSTTPVSDLRGHQLGYRPLNNTYDAWTAAQFERYIRDLALFGANTIEFVPPGADDVAPTAPHMPIDPYDMLAACSGICDACGLDVSLWYPNEGADYTDPACVEKELAERRKIFDLMPRLDVLFVPGGDPGRLDPDTLFPWCERLAGALRERHPRAKMCLSSQGFRVTNAWLERFHARLRAEPEWLDSIAFAPWEREPLPLLRQKVPPRYPIRRYPDITHCHLCQYPVPRWDLAFAMTESREPINPRPIAQKHIHNLYRACAVGSVTYSEGVNDDVNKFVWADQEWDPSIPVAETLADYARLFVGASVADDVARGLLALERNWEGPLADNERVEETLALWQGIDGRAPESVRRNWRFEMGLLRAHYDVCLRRRLLNETALEREAMDVLRAAPPGGAIAALDEARRVLNRAIARPVALDLKQRCDGLADRLWDHVALQLTTTRHHGQRTIRGAFMDSIDRPLNDREWLLEEFDRISALPTGPAQAAGVERIVGRAHPGPGGRYENFGTSESWASVDPGRGWREDPAFYATPLVEYRLDEGPLAWRAAVTARFDAPLTVTWTGLDPQSAYRLTVTYQASPWPYAARLTANGAHLVHDHLDVHRRTRTEEFAIPAGVVADGALRLTWTTRDGELGARVAELRLTPCA